MSEEYALTLPPSPELVTADAVNAWHEWYREMALRSLEGRELSEGELKFETCRLILEYTEAGDTLNNAVREKVLARIERFQLYRYAPEGWGSLSDVIRNLLPGMSASYASEMGAIAETIAPFCERHDIDVFESPEKLGYLREAASALRAIIVGPGAERVKAEIIEEELAFILGEAATRREVRDKYRSIQGQPGVGIVAEAEDDDETVLLIVAPAATAAAIRQKLGRLVSEWNRGTLTPANETRDSKVPGQLLRQKVWSVKSNTMQVVNEETGEIVQEVMT